METWPGMPTEVPSVGLWVSAQKIQKVKVNCSTLDISLSQPLEVFLVHFWEITCEVFWVLCWSGLLLESHRNQLTTSVRWFKVLLLSHLTGRTGFPLVHCREVNKLQAWLDLGTSVISWELCPSPALYIPVPVSFLAGFLLMVAGDGSRSKSNGTKKRTLSFSPPRPQEPGIPFPPTSGSFRWQQ